VDFGAFVDLGIKETALVHISELSDQYVKDPMNIVKVGDVLEFSIIGLDRDRRRISLSRKSQPGSAKARDESPQVSPRENEKRGGKVTVRATPPARPASRRPGDGPRSNKDDDGTMYNPFAEAFKKMKKN